MEFTAINSAVADAMKEISRRVELRQRLEAEGVAMTDEEFIVLAERTGIKI